MIRILAGVAAVGVIVAIAYAWLVVRPIRIRFDEDEPWGHRVG